jgi:hypothetical protein
MVRRRLKHPPKNFTMCTDTEHVEVSDNGNMNMAYILPSHPPRSKHKFLTTATLQNHEGSHTHFKHFSNSNVDPMTEHANFSCLVFQVGRYIISPSLHHEVCIMVMCVCTLLGSNFKPSKLY